MHGPGTVGDDLEKGTCIIAPKSLVGESRGILYGINYKNY